MTINGVQPAITKASPQNIQIEKLSDNEVKQIALARPYQKISSVRKNALYTIFLSIPVVDSFLKSTMTKGSLYKKSAAFAKNSIHWASVYAVGLSVLGLKKAINNRVETLDNFDKKHPVASFGIDIAVLFTALNTAKSGIEKTKTLLKEKAPELLKTIDKKIKKPVSKWLNKTNLNKKHIKAFDKYIAKHPYSKAAGIVMAVITAPIMALATIIRHNKEVNSAIREANNNYVLLGLFNSLLPENTNNIKNPETINDLATKKIIT